MESDSYTPLSPNRKIVTEDSSTSVKKLANVKSESPVHIKLEPVEKKPEVKPQQEQNPGDPKTGQPLPIESRISKFQMAFKFGLHQGDRYCATEYGTNKVIFSPPVLVMIEHIEEMDRLARELPELPPTLELSEQFWTRFNQKRNGPEPSVPEMQVSPIIHQNEDPMVLETPDLPSNPETPQIEQSSSQSSQPLEPARPSKITPNPKRARSTQNIDLGTLPPIKKTKVESTSPDVVDSPLPLTPKVQDMKRREKVATPPLKSEKIVPRKPMEKKSDNEKPTAPEDKPPEPKSSKTLQARIDKFFEVAKVHKHKGDGFKESLNKNESTDYLSMFLFHYIQSALQYLEAFVLQAPNGNLVGQSARLFGAVASDTAKQYPHLMGPKDERYTSLLSLCSSFLYAKSAVLQFTEIENEVKIQKDLILAGQSDHVHRNPLHRLEDKAKAVHTLFVSWSHKPPLPQTLIPPEKLVLMTWEDFLEFIKQNLEQIG